MSTTTLATPHTLDPEREAARCLDAARGWDALAEEQERMATYATSRGHYAGAHLERARTYRMTAESLRLEAATGVGHCSCCARRFEQCARRKLTRTA